MERTEKISTSVTKEEKGRFRVLAAEQDMTMAELLRELVYDEIESPEDEEGPATEGNPNRGTTRTD